MKQYKKNTVQKLAFLFSILFFNTVIGQKKIDIDSLLINTIKEVKVTKDYETAIKKYQIGIKKSPDYLDFHLELARSFQMSKMPDSARYHYKYVIDKNRAYEDAFVNLINLEIAEKKYDNAQNAVDKAINAYPRSEKYYIKKIDIYELQGDEKQETEYLKTLENKFPDNSEIKQRAITLFNKNRSERVGVNYGFTTFDRKGTGNWNLINLVYVRSRNWGSLIGGINYANRNSFQGVQFEAQSFLFMSKKSYSYVDFAFSKSYVFPDFRVAYSYFQNYKKGWESELGFRYIKVSNINLTTAVIGAGKYIGNYWITLKTFILRQDQIFYPAFTLGARYYLDTKYDYLSFVSGYGTSPDERTTLGQFEQRVALKSYRMGGGFSKIFNDKYIVGLQTTVNRQEYAPNLRQNEFDVNLKFEYKF